MKKKTYFRIPLLILVMLCTPMGLSGQEGFKIISGIGIPEFIHVGIQYEGKVNNIGFSMGFIPGVSESLLSVNTHLLFHTKRKEDGSLNRWYMKTGLSYTREETRTTIISNILISLGGGRMISIGQSAGLYIDLGLALNIDENKERKTPKPPSTFNLNIEVPFVPAASIVFFIRI